MNSYTITKNIMNFISEHMVNYVNSTYNRNYKYMIMINSGQIQGVEFVSENGEIKVEFTVDDISLIMRKHKIQNLNSKINI
jgi:hypothetical protein